MVQSEGNDRVKVVPAGDVPAMFSCYRAVLRLRRTVKNREGLVECLDLVIDDRDLVRFG